MKRKRAMQFILQVFTKYTATDNNMCLILYSRNGCKQSHSIVYTSRPYFYREN